MSQSIKAYFTQIEDFRQAKKCKHRLSDILLIGICTYLSNGQDYEDMTLFAQSKGPLLDDLLDLPNGVPSHDTFNRVFQLLKPDLLRSCLGQHGQTLLDILAHKQIALDGKKLRGVTPRSKGTSGLFIVNAWVGENRLCVGQHKVDDKSNEMDALGPLIAHLDITDAVVTIDAIGCQKGLAKQIRHQQGHYLLAVKGNQGALLEEMACAFKASKAKSVSEEWEYARSRFETRTCSILSAASSIDPAYTASWLGLQTLVKIESVRYEGSQQSCQTRYYISDELPESALYFSKLSRGHWGIENHLHWHLDVTFKEDACRVRTGYGPENLSTLRKLALQLVSQRGDTLSLQKRRVKAAYDIEYLRKLLT